VYGWLGNEVDESLMQQELIGRWEKKDMFLQNGTVTSA